MTTMVVKNSGTGVFVQITASVSGSETGVMRVPYAIPSEQLYYWTREWQSAERAALEELAAGEYVEFGGDDPADVARWLREPETNG